MVQERLSERELGSRADVLLHINRKRNYTCPNSHREVEWQQAGIHQNVRGSNCYRYLYEELKKVVEEEKK